MRMWEIWTKTKNKALSKGHVGMLSEDYKKLEGFHFCSTCENRNGQFFLFKLLLQEEDFRVE